MNKSGDQQQQQQQQRTAETGKYRCFWVKDEDESSSSKDEEKAVVLDERLINPLLSKFYAEQDFPQIKSTAPVLAQKSVPLLNTPNFELHLTSST